MENTGYDTFVGEVEKADLQKPGKHRKTGKEKSGEEKVHCYCPGCGHYFGKLGKTSNMYMDCPECGAGNSFIMSGRYKLTVFFERGAKTA